MSTIRSVLARKVHSREAVQVGIVGLGSAPGGWAEVAHLPALAALDGYEVSALSASSVESAARSGERHGIRRTFGTAAELAACDEVDLVIIAVKVPHHRELVTAALERGKAVLCEWPLGNGLAEAEQLAGRAREQDVPTVIGLQARSNPAVRFLRHLVADGYVGDVLSTTITGSGYGWGAEVDPRNRYTLDSANGATLLTIPFAHALDAVASVLGEPERLHIEQTQRLTEAADVTTGEAVPMNSPDQVVAIGRLPGGPVASFHYRGGVNRATNFRWEINGTKGDLVITAPSGHLQLVPITIEGARGDQRQVGVLEVPQTYRPLDNLDPIAQSQAYAVAHAYRQFLEDLRDGTTVVPDFEHAVIRHRSIHSVDSIHAPV